MDVIRRADWIVDVGPAAGEHGDALAGFARRPASGSKRVGGI